MSEQFQPTGPSKEDVRIWLLQRRHSDQPPPAPDQLRADLRQCHGSVEAPAAPPVVPSPDAQIIQAARSLAERGGWRALTVATLARELDISLTLAYQRARSVRALQSAVVALCIAEFEQAVYTPAAQAAADMGGWRRLAELNVGYLASNAQSGLAGPVELSDPSGLPDHLVATIALAKARWRKSWRDAFSAAVSSGELMANAASEGLVDALLAELHKMLGDRATLCPALLIERTLAAIEGLVAGYRAAPAQIRRRPRAARSTFRWPEWLMAGATEQDQRSKT